MLIDTAVTLVISHYRIGFWLSSLMVTFLMLTLLISKDSRRCNILDELLELLLNVVVLSFIRSLNSLHHLSQAVRYVLPSPICLRLSSPGTAC